MSKCRWTMSRPGKKCEPPVCHHTSCWESFFSANPEEKDMADRIVEWLGGENLKLLRGTAYAKMYWRVREDRHGN